jgi:hypothetical protein
MPHWGTIEFNTSGTQVEVGTDIGAEWNSGELVEIVLDDGDMNIDSRSQEQMTVGSNSTIVPAVKIGSPITLATVNNIIYHDASNSKSPVDSGIDDTTCSSDYGAAGTAASYVSCNEKYSERAIITNSGSALTIETDEGLEFAYDGTTVADLQDLISSANGTAAYTYIQYDFRALNGGSNDANAYLNFTVGDDSVTDTNGSAGTDGHAITSAYSTGLIGQALLNSPATKAQGFGSLTTTEKLEVIVTFTPLSGTLSLTGMGAGTSTPLTMDFVTYGQSNDGVTAADRHNNSIYRLEVDEVDAAGGIFVGELDFIMLNQLNVNQTSTYNFTRQTTRRTESLYTMI